MELKALSGIEFFCERKIGWGPCIVQGMRFGFGKIGEFTIAVVEVVAVVTMAGEVGIGSAKEDVLFRQL